MLPDEQAGVAPESSIVNPDAVESEDDAATIPVELADNDDAAMFSNDLVGDAQKTYVAYLKENKTGEAQQGVEISSEYWADGIKALNPAKVYLHLCNLVVAQNVEDGIETGVYIYLPISSYLPQSGDDGFNFPQTGTDSDEKTYHLHEVQKYTRNLN
ncbi:hypothetical protein JXA32_05130 [Candidatus Sumerlaeota bacterium]|nr:hypothetical protein [Candidatus Sumerlaeota bacterium]